MRNKILHVVNISFVLPYYIGEQFDYFKKKGFEFYVACSPSDHLQEYSKLKDFKVIPIKILREISPLSDIQSIYCLIKLIKKEKINTVIGHTPKGGMIAMISSYLAHVDNRIYFRHGLMYETSKGLKRFVLKLIEQLTARLANRIICVSNSVLEKSTKENLNPISKNYLLNIGSCNGIDIYSFCQRNINVIKVENLRNKYGILPQQKVVGYVGRLVKDKGIEELLDSWKILSKKYSNIKLLLVGPFEKRDSIDENYKNYISLNPNIILTGLTNDVLNHYALMNVFILPSYREGLPTVVLEASAMELPIITTKSTGCIDSIVEDKTGVFTKIDSIDIANKIDFYLKNTDIATIHGQNGRDFVVDNFRQEIIWNEIETKVLHNK